MANPEHLQLIKEGKAVWDSARPESPDLRQADLLGANLRHEVLANATLDWCEPQRVGPQRRSPPTGEPRERKPLPNRPQLCEHADGVIAPDSDE